MNRHFIYVDDATSLNACIKDIASVSDVALDIEGSSLYTYKDQVCLIQVATATQVYILDPLILKDINLFLLTLKSKRLICHGADYDIRMLNKQYGYIHPHKIFDTKLAADLLGIEEASLAALLKRYFEKIIKKGDQKSDWRKRPLTDQQLAYAANDVVDLVQLCQMMEKQLAELMRLSWHEEWCDKILANTTEHVEKKDSWRIKGAGVLKRAELNYLKLLWEWRDKEAEKQNRPAFKIISNLFLINFSKIAAQHKNKIISGNFTMPKNINKKYHSEIAYVLLQASKTPTHHWPELVIREKPRLTYDKELFMLLKKLIAKKAKTLNIRPSLLLTNAELTQLLLSFKGHNLEQTLRVSTLMSWQKQLLDAVWSPLEIYKA